MRRLRYRFLPAILLIVGAFLFESAPAFADTPVAAVPILESVSGRAEVRLAGTGMWQTAGAILESVSGRVEVRLAGTGMWQTAGRNSRIDTGDRLRTGPDGTVRVRFLYAGIIEVGPSSEILLMRAERTYRREGWRNFIAIRFDAGVVRPSFPPRLGERHEVYVHTPTAVAGVRGTTFEAALLADGDFVCTVLDGKVEVVDPGDTPAWRRTLPARTALTVRPEKEPSSPVPADSAVLERLAEVRVVASAGVETGTETGPAERAQVLWDAAGFELRVRSAIAAMVEGYERENAAAVLDHVSADYHGATTGGRVVDRSGLERSLACDFEIFDEFRFQAAPEVVRVNADRREAEAIMLWNARARYFATGLDVVNKTRRTRLVFREEDGAARLLRQDIAGLSDGTVMLGRADPATCTALVRADAGSQSGQGVQSVAGSSSSAGASVFPLTISASRTFDADLVVPAGQTLTLSSGSIITFSGNFKLQVFGTLNATRATIRGAGGWQGVVFEAGSGGTLTGSTIQNAATGIMMSGGTVSATTMTMNSNTSNVNITGGALTLGGTIAQTGSLENIQLVNGTLTLTNATVTGGDRCVDMDAGTLNITGGSSISISTLNALLLAGTINISGTNTFGGTVNVANLGPVTMTVTGTNTFSSGGIIVFAGATVSITGATIRNPLGAGVLYAGGTLSMTNCIIENCANEGITSNPGSTLTLANCTIRNNTNFGLDLQGSLTASGTTISGNGAGGIRSNGGAITFNSPAVTVSGNTGVGFDALGGTFTATNANFRNNTGFGINNNIGGALNLTNAFISDNGGAIGAEVGGPGLVGPNLQIGTSAVNCVTALAATQN